MFVSFFLQQVNPELVFLTRVPRGLSNGSVVHLEGSYDDWQLSDEYRVALTCDPEGNPTHHNPGEVAIQCTISFSFRTISCKSFIQGEWSVKESGIGFPLAPRERFLLTFECLLYAFKLKVNGVDVGVFAYRLPVEKIRNLLVTGRGAHVLQVAIENVALHHTPERVPVPFSFHNSVGIQQGMASSSRNDGFTAYHSQLLPQAQFHDQNALGSLVHAMIPLIANIMQPAAPGNPPYPSNNTFNHQQPREPSQPTSNSPFNVGFNGWQPSNSQMPPAADEPSDGMKTPEHLVSHNPRKQPHMGHMGYGASLPPSSVFLSEVTTASQQDKKELKDTERTEVTRGNAAAEWEPPPFVNYFLGPSDSSPDSSDSRERDAKGPVTTSELRSIIAEMEKEVGEKSNTNTTSSPDRRTPRIRVSDSLLEDMSKNSEEEKNVTRYVEQAALDESSPSQKHTRDK
ncbi:unnamed protein product [Notodromas monacha]|uniref:Galectin n=1 Tax=Notodromas monacha TaxID=399045 RepID=A0A7R9BZE5_9CRUS|nr:unnamed protein product [Notodromas monacha]CAG0923285.1 unnamed protein product [Notodromas monacha]